MLVPEYKKGYSLLYGSIHFYIVFKMFATIYERIVKAKQLIVAKVDEDLSKESIKEVLKLDVGAEEYEKLLTIFKKELIEERFEIFQSAVIGTLSQTPHKKLDSAHYEDILRNIMGG